MRRSLLLLALLPLAVPAPARAQDGTDARIRSALSAALPALGEHATIVDLDGTVLRKGTSDWVCMPDMPDVPNDSPMCLDATWREVIDAWQNHREPRVRALGISYMLRGDLPVSNTDPFATAPTPDNAWIQVGKPHIMLVLPDPALLEGVSTDPDNGGPWVMWKGTPYAHVMIPTVPRTR